MYQRYIHRPGVEDGEHYVIDTHNPDPNEDIVAVVRLPEVEVEAMVRKLNARHTVRALAGRNPTPRSPR